jgi:hypothetical protein
MEMSDPKILLEIERIYRQKEARINSLPFNPHPRSNSVVFADEIIKGQTNTKLKI